MKSKDYQSRDKFFYAVPSLFPTWDFPSRLAIGINLNDFSARNAPYYQFLVKGTMYRISKEKAATVVMTHIAPFGSMPHLIPKECFDVVKENIPVQPEYEWDNTANTARIKVPRKMKEVNVQLSIS
jgi:hypothetical protein